MTVMPDMAILLVPCMSLPPDPIGYLQSWSGELNAQASRIRQLIGDRHWPSDGRHKELVLMAFLKKYLPPNLVLGSGFITGRNISADCSTEIDIVVTDPSIEPAWLHENTIVITPPSPVLAQIQVKSQFQASSLQDVLEGFASSASLFSGDTCWYGGFFYDLGEKTVESLNETLKSKFGALVSGDSSKFLRTPICIACLSGALFLIDAKNNELARTRTYKIRTFQLSTLSPAIFTAHLLQHISRASAPPRMLEFTRFIASLDESIIDTTMIDTKLT